MMIAAAEVVDMTMESFELFHHCGLSQLSFSPSRHSPPCRVVVYTAHHAAFDVQSWGRQGRSNNAQTKDMSRGWTICSAAVSSSSIIIMKVGRKKKGIKNERNT
jgi:hypothetical protein